MSEGIVKDFIASEEDEMKRLVKKIGSGACRNMEEYKGLCGQIYAHGRAIDNIRLVVKKYYEIEEQEK